MASDPLHGLLHIQHRNSFWGKESKFHIALFSDANMEVSYLEDAKEKKGFWGWLRSFFYKPLEVYDNLSQRTLKLYVNTKDLEDKLVDLGLNKSLVKQSIKENRLNELILEYKTETTYELFPPNLVTKAQVREALSWINEQDLDSLPLKTKLAQIGLDNLADSPITVINHEGNFSLKVSDFEVGLDEVGLQIKKDVLKQNCISSFEIEKIDKYFRSQIKEIKEHFLENPNQPLIRYSSYEGVTRNPDSEFSNRKIVIISPCNAMIETDIKLGRGSYKTIKKVINLFSGKSFAHYSVLKGGTRWDNLSNLHEISILENYQTSKKIVKLHQVIDEAAAGAFKHVYTKFYNKGTLYDVFTKHILTTDEQKSIAKQLIKGLKIIHDNLCIHRDLKPENILAELNKQGKLKVVISDLGSVTNLRETEKRKEHLTTEAYISPEYAKALSKLRAAIHKNKQDPSVSNKLKVDDAEEAFMSTVNQALDIWSLGIILYELVHNKKPFGITDRNYQFHVQNIDYNLIFPQDHPLNPIIRMMLAPPDQRATIQEISERLKSIN